MIANDYYFFSLRHSTQRIGLTMIPDGKIVFIKPLKPGGISIVNLFAKGMIIVLKAKKLQKMSPKGTQLRSRRKDFVFLHATHGKSSLKIRQANHLETIKKNNFRK